jgi:pimeloyl-[acyl-carrier protein] methyl ester esterase
VTDGFSGNPLVLLHGWGSNQRVFDALSSRLPRHVEIVRPDLPGHGRSDAPTALLAAGIDTLAAHLAARLPQRAHLVGWSLGGLAALALAGTQPQRVASLTLIASTPRFLAAPDWPHGLAPEVLESFAEQLRADPVRTVHEFLELQVRGSANGQNTLAALRTAIATQGYASPAALAGGLELLRETDLRDRLERVAAPALVIGGQYDRITPPGAGRALAASLPAGRYCEIARAGHAPFVSHAEQVAAWIEEHVVAR